MFDFHHHHLHQKNGIYQYSLDEKQPDFSFSIGIHPKNIGCDWEIAFETLSEIAKHPFCKAIGECGLDVFSISDIALQKKVFQSQIQLANQLQKPLIIHCVRAFSEVIHETKSAQTPKIIHGFRKKKSVGEMLIHQHFYLSFGEALLYDVALQDTFKTTPPSKILLETDTSEISICELYKKAQSLVGFDIENQIQQNLLDIGIVD